ncbi:MAG: hypothetical protein QW103_02015 [Candidatus Pacearchaeota archaeon]
MKKLKLNPSSRDNRRYFLVQCDDEKKIEKAILDYIGILGMAKSAYVFVEKKKNFVIGSCIREKLNDVLASLAFAGLKVKRVSGTIKGLNKKV